jgi:hypothetical protein
MPAQEVKNTRPAHAPQGLSDAVAPVLVLPRTICPTVQMNGGEPTREAKTLSCTYVSTSVEI